MGKKLAFERYHWFHGQVRAGRFPNARTLAEEFRLSGKQAQRDIEFIRDRLDAPLAYDPGQKGYIYEHTGWELPPLWFGEDELVGLCLALRLAATLPDQRLKDSLHGLIEKFLAFRFLDPPPDLADLREKVSVKNVGYYRVDGALFHRVVGALFRGESLRIAYHTPHKRESTERLIHPLHLLCYMGNWHLIAYCSERRELRDFVLSRIRSMVPVLSAIPLPEGLPSMHEYVERHFGLMQGAEAVKIRLRFSPDIADWVSEQIWFRGQEVEAADDGSLCLTFPVADFREVRREILKFGSKVEVLSPPELRDEIRHEIEKMATVYKKR